MGLDLTGNNTVSDALEIHAEGLRKCESRKELTAYIDEMFATFEGYSSCKETQEAVLGVTDWIVSEIKPPLHVLANNQESLFAAYNNALRDVEQERRKLIEGLADCQDQDKILEDFKANVIDKIQKYDAYDAGMLRRDLAYRVYEFVTGKLGSTLADVYETFSTDIENLAEWTDLPPALVFANLMDDVANIREMEEE